MVRKQLKDLSLKIGKVDVVPVFTSAKKEKDLKHSEVKPVVVSNQCVGYRFKYRLCDTDYIGYTTRHLHKRIEEHESHWASAVDQHMIYSQTQRKTKL